MRHKGLGVVWIIIIILIIFLFLGFGAWWYWTNYMSPSESSGPTLATAVPSTSGKMDSALVGTWESECLVPAPTNSKYAEKHKFVINANGTAEHWRWTYGMIDCTTLEPASTIHDTFKLTFPGSNKINLSWTAYENSQMSSEQLQSFTGNTMYDIYQTNGISLKFGHGFRNSSELTGGSGGSEGDRFTTLNEYIVYKKK